MKTDSFTRNLFKYVVASLLLPSFILFSILFMDEKDYTGHLGRSVFNKQLDAQVENVKYWVGLKVGYLDTAAELLEGNIKAIPMTEQGPNVISSLTIIKESSAEIINAYYSDEVGNNYVNGHRAPKVDGRKRQWYKGAMAEASYVSSPYQDVLTNKTVITFSHRIDDLNGKPVGVLGYDIVFDDLIVKLKKCVANINGKIQLVEGNDISKRVQELNPKIPNNFFSKAGDGDYATDGKFYYIRALGVGDYRIIFEIDGRQFVRNYFSQGNDYQVRLAIALLIIVLLAGFVVNRFSRPVKSLTESIYAFLGTDRGLLDLENQDEDLLEIFELFNKFNDHLIENITDLESANSELKDQQDQLTLKYQELNVVKEELLSFNVALQEKDGLYSDIIDNISDLIWTTDDCGILTYVSKNLSEMLGYGEKELVGQSIGILLPEISKEHTDIYELFGKRDFEGIELQLYHKDGMGSIIVNTRTTRISEGGRLLSIQAIARDITQDKKLFVDYFYKNRELFVINEVNRVMTSTGNDLSRVLQSITDKVNTLMNVSFCGIRTLKGDVLEMTAQSGNVHGFIYKESVDIHQSHMGLALKNNDIINLRSPNDMLMEEPLVDKAFEEIGNLIFIPLRNNDNLFGVLNVGARKPLEADKISMLRYLSQSASISIEKASIYERLRENYLKTIESLANALEEKLYNMHGHTIRVSKYATAIASRMYLKEIEVDEVNIAGLLHDIGKIGINDEILRTSIASQANMEESLVKIIECHPGIGKRILSPIGLSPRVIEGIYLHHKRFDLTGYPVEEVVDEQPLIAQIIQVADGFDNLVRGTYTGTRMTMSGAVSLMKKEAGTAYGPEVIDILEDLVINDQDKLLSIEYA